MPPVQHRGSSTDIKQRKQRDTEFEKNNVAEGFWVVPSPWNEQMFYTQTSSFWKGLGWLQCAFSPKLELFCCCRRPWHYKSYRNILSHYIKHIYIRLEKSGKTQQNNTWVYKRLLVISYKWQSNEVMRTVLSLFCALCYIFVCVRSKNRCCRYFFCVSSM